MHRPYTLPRYNVKRHTVVQPPDQSYRLIPLTQDQNAIVDASDFEWLSQWNWRAQWNPPTRSFYALRPDWRKERLIFMHAQILECGPRERGDHVNHNTLDNRRANLRKCSHAENCRNKKKRLDNTSGFKGVGWDRQCSKWGASIGHNGKRIKIGRFDSIEDAARAYDEAARKYHGEFAVLNFPAT